MGVSLSWQAVDYPVASHQLLAYGSLQPSTASNYIVAGDTAALSEGDYAANGVEIFNGPPRAWSIANTTLAQIVTPDGYLVASSFGVNWSRQSTEAVARLAGTTSVTVGSGTYVLRVIPKVTVSGATSLPSTGGAVFTASSIGCNTTCQYTWYVEDGAASYYQGTGSSIRIYSDPSWQSYVDVKAVASTNGVTGENSKHVRNFGSSCGTQKAC
jgi:hypothetical protein